VGTFHVQVIAMCALALFAAGYDAEALNAAAPDIARALDLPVSAFGASFKWGAAGAVIGMVLGGLGDRWGRRRGVILSLLIFGAASLGSILAETPNAFAILRFITGLGFGALLPNAVSLVFEVMPKRRRFTLAVLAWLGFPVGGLLAPPIVARLLERWVFEGVFVLGGLLPIVLALVFSGLLPESPLLLARQGEHANARMRATMLRISRRFSGLDGMTVFLADAPDEPGPRSLGLVRGGRLGFTLMLWLAFAAASCAAAIFTAGLVAKLQSAGVDPDTAASERFLAGAVGIPGALVLAYAADRWNRFWVAAAALLLGAAAIGSVAASSAPWPLYLGLLAAGFLAIGVLGLLPAISASGYPTPVRATGAGWAMAAGRFGQAAAPYGLLQAHETPAIVIAAAAVFALIAAAAAAAAVPARRRKA
jgi:MFS transporter, AAHS family, 4-hydroxybenzoate transporter